MTDQQQVEELVDAEVDHDEEYADAYGFWIFAFAVIGAVVGYNIGAEAGFGFLANLGLGAIGFFALSMVAYKFREIIAKVGAVVILALVVFAVIEGIRGA